MWTPGPLQQKFQSLSIHGHVAGLHERATMVFVLVLREQSLWTARRVPPSLPAGERRLSGWPAGRPGGRPVVARGGPACDDESLRHHMARFKTAKTFRAGCGADAVNRLANRHLMQQSAVGRSSPASADVPCFRSLENALLHSRMGAVRPPACPAF